MGKKQFIAAKKFNSTSKVAQSLELPTTNQNNLAVWN